MLLRRTALIAATAVAFACEPSVPHGTNPTFVDTAAFDLTPSHPDIPLPNDLALLPASVSGQVGAQQELLKEFQKAGGFPNDQEVPITIDFVRQTIDPATGAQTPSAPALDVTSISSSNLVLFSIGDPSGPPASYGAPIAFDPPKPTDYVTSGDHGTLTVHKTPDSATHSRRFAPARYVVAVRGGPNGVKVTGNAQGLSPAPAMYLLLQDQNLGLPQNQTLIPGNTPAEKQTNAAALEAIRKTYIFPLLVVDGAFPHKEIAVMSTFKIAPITTAHVETDPGAGLIPLPSDFLLDPATGGSTVVKNPAFGPLAAGIATLDGFSTTAMILSQVSAPILAGTVRGNAYLYELDLKSSPPKATKLAELVESIGDSANPPRFVAEPKAITKDIPDGRGGTITVSTAIGLQPAVPAPVLGVGLVAIPALKEGTEYAVILTDGIKDVNGQGLSRSTLGKLLLFQNQLSVGGKSAVPGVDDATAGALEQMRQVLALPVGTLVATPGSGITKDNVVMAYTFRTQTFSNTAVNLAAAPYNPALPAAVQAALKEPVAGSTVGYCASGCTPGTFDTVAAKYAVDPALVGLDNGNIKGIVETTILTLNILNPATGAAQPDSTQWTAEPLNVLLSVPTATAPATAGGTPCSGGTPAAPCVAPLIVFRHGIFGSRASVLTVMDQLSAKGFAVAAIDANKHGDRTFCSADNQCIPGAKCTPVDALSHQGDTAGATPGKCTAPASVPKVNGSYFANKPTNCGSAATCGVANAGLPAASGNFLVSGNLFRTRDSLRQDILDQSQLLHVIARAPASTDANSQLFLTLAGGFGVVIDPRLTFFLGQSLGAISGTVDVAANPRFSQAVLNVGGGTIVDVFSNSSLAQGPNGLNALLASLGIALGTPAYLQFINVAKWILDPADPLNYAQHLTANTLPNLFLPPDGKPDGSVAQRPKRILGQVAACDSTVPNPFNLELYKTIGLGPLSAANSTLQTFITDPSAFSSALGLDVGCPTGAVTHGFITDWKIPSITTKGQTDAASFLLGQTVPLIETP